MAGRGPRRDQIANALLPTCGALPSSASIVRVQGVVLVPTVPALGCTAVRLGPGTNVLVPNGVPLRPCDVSR